MDAAAIDQVQLNFNPQGLLIINLAIALMMLGVALELRLEDFRRIARAPVAPAIGLFAQFLLLPFATFLLTLVIDVAPSMKLGMLLVAACPGGNLSNVITHLAKGNAAVSVSMTAVSTLAAIVMTPLNLALWGGLQPDTAAILEAVHLDPFAVLRSVALILGVPLVVGLTVARLFPGFAERVRKPFRIFSLVVFLVIVVGALVLNREHFVAHVGVVALVVAVHNAVALGLGWTAGRIVGLAERDKRAVAIEVGIQNSALGLVLVFDFFGGLGGMAIVVAWWGIWHIVAGLTVAAVLSRRPVPEG